MNLPKLTKQEAGTFTAVLTDIINQENVESKRGNSDVMIFYFQLNSGKIVTRRFYYGQFDFTESHPLAKFILSLGGSLEENFDLDSLTNNDYLVEIELNVGPDGRVYENVKSVTTI